METHLITTYDDTTLDKVRAGLRKAIMGLTDQSCTDIISAMQNQGILFRERAEVSVPSEGGWVPTPLPAQALEDVALSEWCRQAVVTAAALALGDEVTDLREASEDIAHSLHRHVQAVIDAVIAGTTKAVRREKPAVVGYSPEVLRMATAREMLVELRDRFESSSSLSWAANACTTLLIQIPEDVQELHATRTEWNGSTHFLALARSVEEMRLAEAEPNEVAQQRHLRVAAGWAAVARAAQP